MKWLKISWRNVLRNKRRSVTAMLTVAIATIAIISAYGYINFTFWGLSRSIVQGGTGNMHIADNRLFTGFEQHALEFGISNDDADKTVADLTNHHNIKQALKRLEFSGIISKGEVSTVFRGTGIESKKEFRLRAGNVSGKNVKGKRIIGDNPHQVELTIDLARKLKAEIGDTVTILSTTVDGGINAIDTQVVSIYSTGIPIRDTLELKTPISFAQELLNTDRISRIVVELRDLDGTMAMLGTVKNIISSDKGIKTWYELEPYFQAVQKIYYSIFSVMGIIILSVVLLSVSNVMATSVMERVPEIGTLRAFGITAGRVKINFVIEGIIIAMIGVIVGIILSLVVVVLVNTSGYMMPPPPGRSQGYPLMLLPTLDSILIVIGVMAVIGAVGSYLPISRIVKKKVVEQINYV